MKPLKCCRHRQDERTIHYEDLCTLNQKHVSHPQWFSISLCMFREKAHTAQKWFQRKTLAQKFCIPQVSYTWWRLWEISVCSILVFISICIYNYNWGNLCKKGIYCFCSPLPFFCSTKQNLALLTCLPRKSHCHLSGLTQSLFLRNMYANCFIYWCIIIYWCHYLNLEWQL